MHCSTHVGILRVGPANQAIKLAFIVLISFLRLKLCLVQVYADRFEAEKVRLHVLLGMDHEGLERLGVHAIGERETIINGVYEYLRAYLRAAEPFASGGR